MYEALVVSSDQQKFPKLNSMARVMVDSPALLLMNSNIFICNQNFYASIWDNYIFVDPTHWIGGIVTTTRQKSDMR